MREGGGSNFLLRLRRLLSILVWYTAREKLKLKVPCLCLPIFLSGSLLPFPSFFFHELIIGKGGLCFLLVPRLIIKSERGKREKKEKQEQEQGCFLFHCLPRAKVCFFSKLPPPSPSRSPLPIAKLRLISCRLLLLFLLPFLRPRGKKASHGRHKRFLLSGIGGKAAPLRARG